MLRKVMGICAVLATVGIANSAWAQTCTSDSDCAGALLCDDIMAARDSFEASGFPLSGGPIRFETGAQAIFVRDPDRNVIELDQRG